MVKLSCFSVRDVKADGFITPWFLQNDAMAVRVFQDCVRDSNHQFGKHPEDYTLFRVGEFDVLSGAFVPEALGPQLLVSGLQVREARGEAES